MFNSVKNFPAIKYISRLNIPGVAYGVISLFLFFSIIRPRFLSMVNILLIMRYSSVLILASIGMTMVILISQMDLSIGSVMSLSGVIAAVCIGRGVSFPLAILIGMIAGVLIGLLNGVLIAYFKFDFWITTFATMGIGAGLALVVANGETIAITYEGFSWIGNGKIMGIYVLIYITVIIVACMLFVLRRTGFGYRIYSIGGSEQTARLSGIPVVKNQIMVYMCSGLFASVAGLLLTSMGNAASPIAGADYSFDAIAAVVIGGTSFDGGRGGLSGTILGALLLRILASGLNLMDVPATWQKAIIGLVVVIIIVANVLAEKVKKNNDLRRRYADA